MRAIVVDSDRQFEQYLSERARRELDGRDEMWDGVLQLVPAPSANHQNLQAFLIQHLRPVAEHGHLILTGDTAIYADVDDYKVPDLIAASAGQWSHRGVEQKAQLVIEILSPGDQTMEKVPWYAERVGELIVIHRDTLAISRWLQGRVCPANSPGGYHALTTLPVGLVGANGALELSTSRGIMTYRNLL